MSELELHQSQSPLADQMKYAQAVSSANLLPQAYRGKPADIMLAMGLGQAMGLSPAESLYRIDVIQGKPTASAELIAANVRKAGHKLRVSGDDNSATCTIIRADDPEFEFTVTRDAAWAKSMGLDKKDNYLKQRGTMLQWRAITATARLACPEALYGVVYSADEMYDMPGVSSGGGGLAGLLNPENADPGTDGPPSAPAGADDAPTSELGSVSEPDSSRLLTNTTKFGKAFYARVAERKFGSDQERLEYIAETIGRFIESTKEMTEDEARKVMARLDDEDGITEAEPVA